VGPAEVAAPAAESAVIFGLVARGLDIVIEIRFELSDDLFLNPLRKAMQRYRRFRFPAVALAIGTRATIEMLLASAVTSVGEIRIGRKADAQKLGNYSLTSI
jgi:hypothetical protein